MKEEKKEKVHTVLEVVKKVELKEDDGKAEPSSPPKVNTVEKESGKEDSGEKRVLMYTPIKVGSVSISRCLIDTGSKVNIMPIKLATKYGLPYSSAGV